MTVAAAFARILELYESRGYHEPVGLVESVARAYAAAEPASVVVPVDLSARVDRIRCAAFELAVEVAERSTVEHFALPVGWPGRLGC